MILCPSRRHNLPLPLEMISRNFPKLSLRNCLFSNVLTRFDSISPWLVLLALVWVLSLLWESGHQILPFLIMRPNKISVRINIYLHLHCHLLIYYFLHYIYICQYVILLNIFSSLLGFPYTPMHSMLPFLCLGIGIDDMFVIVQVLFVF